MFFCPAVSHTEVVYHSPISLKGLMELLSVPKTMFVYQRSLSRWCFHQRRIWWHKVLRLRLLEMCIHSRCSKTEDGSHLLWKHLVVVFVELLLTMSITCRNRNYYSFVMVYSPSCPSKPSTTCKKWCWMDVQTLWMGV